MFSNNTSTIGSILSYFQSFTAKPKELPVIIIPKKPHRSRSDYSANKTAGLELPDAIHACKSSAAQKATIDAPNTSFFSSLLSLFSTTTPITTVASNKKMEADCKETSKDRHDIQETIITLESELKKIKDTDPSKADDLTIQKVELVAEYIKEHAARRVDLFFYLLIAVHGKHFIISKDHTTKQHGKGSSKKGTHACHSSLFPNLKFERPPSTLAWLFNSSPCPSLSDTQLIESLNMTMELPIIVNALDGHLEGRYAPTSYSKICLILLNKVSNNEIDIKDAMSIFLKTMHDFFEHFHKKYLVKKNIETPNAMKQVWEYEKQGTFQAANSDLKTVSDAYLYLMLRLKPDEIAKVKNNPTSISQYYQSLQEEIFNSKPLKKSNR